MSLQDKTRSPTPNNTEKGGHRSNNVHVQYTIFLLILEDRGVNEWGQSYGWYYWFSDSRSPASSSNFRRTLLLASPAPPPPPPAASSASAFSSFRRSASTFAFSLLICQFCTLFSESRSRDGWREGDEGTRVTPDRRGRNMYYNRKSPIVRVRCYWCIIEKWVKAKAFNRQPSWLGEKRTRTYEIFLYTTKFNVQQQ